MLMNSHCPFTRHSCTDCALFRGRHHYLNFPKQDRMRHTGVPEGRRSIDLRALEKFAEPWTGKDCQGKIEPRIKLKVIDMETDDIRICELSDAKAWDWSHPRTLRFIDGRYVNSLDHFIEILCYKAEKGCEEAEIYEAPPFVLFGGG